MTPWARGPATRRERFEALAPGLIEPLRRFLARRTDPATADDVLADTLLVCWRRLDDVPDEALPWAYGVARNCLANAERSGRRQERAGREDRGRRPAGRVDARPGRAATRTWPRRWPRCAPRTPSCSACGRGSS